MVSGKITAKATTDTISTDIVVATSRPRLRDALRSIGECADLSAPAHRCSVTAAGGAPVVGSSPKRLRSTATFGPMSWRSRTKRCAAPATWF